MKNKLEERMITTIYLVRHADSSYSTDEVNRPISKAGVLDALALHKQFENIKIDKVYSSPYKRSIQTVEEIAESRKLSVELRENFKERKKSNGKLDDFFNNVKKLWDDVHYKFEGGESNMEGQSRGIDAINSVLDENKGKTIVIGTHGDLMSLILNYYDRSFAYEFWRRLDMPDSYKLEFDNSTLKSIEQIWLRP